MATSIRLLTFPILLSFTLMAQRATYTNTSGTVTLAANLSITGSLVASPAGSFSLSCPVTALPPGTY